MMKQNVPQKLHYDRIRFESVEMEPIDIAIVLAIISGVIGGIVFIWCIVDYITRYDWE